MSDIYKRFYKLMIKDCKKVADITRATGIKSTVFSEWKKGKSTPNAEKLLKIAKSLDVSMEYLMTGQESKYAISPFEYDLILAYRHADKLDQALVDRVLKIEDEKKEAALRA